MSKKSKDSKENQNDLGNQISKDNQKNEGSKVNPNDRNNQSNQNGIGTKKDTTAKSKETLTVGSTFPSVSTDALNSGIF